MTPSSNVGTPHGSHQPSLPHKEGELPLPFTSLWNRDKRSQKDQKGMRIVAFDKDKICFRVNPGSKEKYSPNFKRNLPVKQ